MLPRSIAWIVGWGGDEDVLSITLGSDDHVCYILEHTLAAQVAIGLTGQLLIRAGIRFSMLSLAGHKMTATNNMTKSFIAEAPR